MSHLAEEQVAGVLRQWIGTTTPKFLGEGMEGAVYEVDAALNRADVTRALLG
ncbi:hypothetical protein GAR06_03628 [Micromonospora saelicesensis]|uniref:hypothetical protein n=1 Tax=Micromonospora saelicesensis TaxID=285676 RepID=UPI000DC51992|nr:hypothetical protein [Micromonospora saelicesensis]RAO45437.1 hypothetical protein GAR06_03628 [Micromonospora saelicesensis]